LVLVGLARNTEQDYSQRSLIRYHVKSTIWLIALLLGGLLCFSGAGCKKQTPFPENRRRLKRRLFIAHLA